MASAIDSLTGGATGVGSSGSLDHVLRRASAQTGVDFEYLLQTAQRESSLNPNLKAQTSSATGLFQFIEQTWFATVKSDGARFGLAKQAQQIEQNPDGRFFVRNGEARQAILELRKDPDISAKLAGALTQRNAFSLSQAIGREPSGGELYIAHFLGAKGAINLINARQNQADQSAAALFPEAARANKPIFYEKNGEARSVAEVHSLLISRHDVSRPPSPSQPDPQRALASHAPVDNKSSGGLASGPEAAFLAGHFSGGVNAFAAQNGVNAGAFGSVLTRSTEPSQANQVPFAQTTFFAPNNNSLSHKPVARRDDVGTIPSRYGRTDETDIAAFSINADTLGVVEGGNDFAGTSGSVQDVTLYPSVFNQEKTVALTNSQVGKTDLPLDLSHYLKQPPSK